MAINVNDSNFNEVVINSAKPAIVDFWAPWCGPCRVIAPIIEELYNEMSDKVVVAKCDVDTCNSVPSDYGIRNIPTLLFFKDGKVVDKIVGTTQKSVIITKLNSLL